MSEKRNLRIFCPVHEASFEIVENPKIICEIAGHALSSDFPNAEFWEFCCNCETFSPSKLGRGEKARAACFSCQNEVAKRFVCTSCKVISFECSTQAKGKSYFVKTSGIEPKCPGCRQTPVSARVVRHECRDIDAVIFTALESCAFCLEKTTPFPEAQNISSPSGFCPNCRTPIVPGTAFCGNCRYQLRSDIPGSKLGTDVTRSRLLGSLCPNCSSSILPDSLYCAECGQAVRGSIEPPAPTLHPPPTPPPTPVISKTKSSPVAKIFGVAAVLFIFVMVVVGIRSAIEKGSTSNSPTRTPLPASTASPTGRTSANTNSYLLPENTEYKYSGAIGAKNIKFTMSLTRSGTQLTGIAETPRSWDKLTGTIDDAGYFELSGYEKGNMGKNTGQYSGQISGSGTITGRWVDSSGTTGSDFTVNK